LVLTAFVAVSHVRVWTGDIGFNWYYPGLWNFGGVVMGTISWILFTLFIAEKKPIKLLSPEQAGKRFRSLCDGFVLAPKRFWVGFCGEENKSQIETPVPRSAVATPADFVGTGIK